MAPNHFFFVLKYAPSGREEQRQQKHDYFWSGTMKIIFKVHLLVENSLKVQSLPQKAKFLGSVSLICNNLQVNALFLWQWGKWLYYWYCQYKMFCGLYTKDWPFSFPILNKMYAPITYRIYLNLQNEDIVLSDVNNNINFIDIFWKMITIFRIVENINWSFQNHSS